MSRSDPTHKLDDFVLAAEPNVLLVTGDYGAGKTHFLQGWMAHCRDKFAASTEVLYFSAADGEDFPPIRNVSQFLYKVTFAVKTAYGIPRSIETTSSRQLACLGKFLEIVHSIRKKTIVLVLDNVDLLTSGTDEVKYPQWLPSVWKLDPCPCKIIVGASLSSSTAKQLLKSVDLDLETLYVGPLEEQSRHNIIQQYQQRCSVVLDPSIIASLTQATVTTNPSCLIHTLRLTANNVQAATNTIQTVASLSSPYSMLTLLLTILVEEYKEEQRCHCRLALCSLAIADYGLTEQELAAVTVIPEEFLVRASTVLGCVVCMDGQWIIQSSRIKDVIVSYFELTDSERIEIHSRVCAAMVADKGTQVGKVVFHCEGARQWAKVKELVTDLEVFSVLCSSSRLAFSLSQTWRKLISLKLDPVTEYNKAVESIASTRHLTGGGLFVVVAYIALFFKEYCLLDRENTPSFLHPPFLSAKDLQTMGLLEELSKLEGMVTNEEENKAIMSRAPSRAGESSVALTSLQNHKRTSYYFYKRWVWQQLPWLCAQPDLDLQFDSIMTVARPVPSNNGLSEHIRDLAVRFADVVRNGSRSSEVPGAASLHSQLSTAIPSSPAATPLPVSISVSSSNGYSPSHKESSSKRLQPDTVHLPNISLSQSYDESYLLPMDRINSASTRSLPSLSHESPSQFSRELSHVSSKSYLAKGRRDDSQSNQFMLSESAPFSLANVSEHVEHIVHKKLASLDDRNQQLASQLNSTIFERTTAQKRHKALLETVEHLFREQNTRQQLQNQVVKFDTKLRAVGKKLQQAEAEARWLQTVGALLERNGPKNERWFHAIERNAKEFNGLVSTVHTNLGDAKRQEEEYHHKSVELKRLIQEHSDIRESLFARFKDKCQLVEDITTATESSGSVLTSVQFYSGPEPEQFPQSFEDDSEQNGWTNVLYDLEPSERLAVIFERLETVHGVVSDDQLIKLFRLLKGDVNFESLAAQMEVDMDKLTEQKNRLSADLKDQVEDLVNGLDQSTTSEIYRKLAEAEERASRLTSQFTSLDSQLQQVHDRVALIGARVKDTHEDDNTTATTVDQLSVIESRNLFMLGVVNRFNLAESQPESGPTEVAEAKVRTKLSVGARHKGPRIPPAQRAPESNHINSKAGSLSATVSASATVTVVPDGMKRGASEARLLHSYELPHRLLGALKEKTNKTFLH